MGGPFLPPLPQFQRTLGITQSVEMGESRSSHHCHCSWLRLPASSEAGQLPGSHIHTLGPLLLGAVLPSAMRTPPHGTDQYGWELKSSGLSHWGNIALPCSGIFPGSSPLQSLTVKAPNFPPHCQPGQSSHPCPLSKLEKGTLCSRKVIALT